MFRKHKYKKLCFNTININNINNEKNSLEILKFKVYTCFFF